MAHLKDQETVKLKRTQAVHIESKLIPEMKRKVGNCYVAEFQKSQIEEKILKNKEDLLRKQNEKYMGTLDLGNPSDEEMRRVTCLKKEAIRKELMAQLQDNQRRMAREHCESLKANTLFIDLENQQIEEEKRKLCEKKKQLQQMQGKQPLLRLDYVRRERREAAGDVRGWENKNLVDLLRPAVKKKNPADAYKEAVRDSIRKRLEEIETEKELTEIARIEYSHLNDEDIRRLGSYNRMNKTSLQEVKAQNKKDMLETMMNKQNERDAKRDYEKSIEEAHQQIKAKSLAKEDEKNRLKEQKNREYRAQLRQQTKEKYHYLKEENDSEIGMFRKTQQVHAEFKELEAQELQRLKVDLPFKSQFGIICKPCLFRTDQCSGTHDGSKLCCQEPSN